MCFLASCFLAPLLPCSFPSVSPCSFGPLPVCFHDFLAPLLRCSLPFFLPPSFIPSFLPSFLSSSLPLSSYVDAFAVFFILKFWLYALYSYRTQEGFFNFATCPESRFNRKPSRGCRGRSYLPRAPCAVERATALCLGRCKRRQPVLVPLLHTYPTIFPAALVS